MFYTRLKSAVVALSLAMSLGLPAAHAQGTNGGQTGNAQQPSDGGGNITTLNAGQPIPDRYIVVLNDGVANPPAVANDMARAYGLQNTHVYGKVLKGFVTTVPAGQLNALSRDPRVKYVEQDRTVRAYAVDVPTGVSRIFAPGNPEIGIDGNDDVRIDVDVAVIDTGIDATHPLLNVSGTQTDCTSGTCIDGFAPDGNGHGTHVAGTIGAIDNGGGVVGVAPGARLRGVKVLNDSGSGSISGVIAGVDWVTKQRIRVANMSLGAPASKGKKPDPLCDAITASTAEGVVHVVAAGNENQDAALSTPAHCPDAIAVSAIADYDGLPGGSGKPTCNNYGADDTKASFSNWSNTVPLIAAPGVCIHSTWTGGGYNTISGTSMATPHVTGAAALIVATDPNVSPSVVRDRLYNKGNSGWLDNSGDGKQEPLLDVSNTSVFNPVTQPSPIDTTAPTVSITDPIAGTKVSGKSVPIRITATDDVSSPANLTVTYTVGSNSTPAYQASYDGSAFVGTWDSTTVADGDPTIFAHAKDMSGKTGDSIGTTVHVSNGSGTPSTSTLFGLQNDEMGCKNSKRALVFSLTMVDDQSAPTSNVTVAVTISLNGGTGGTWDASGTTDSTGTVGWRMLMPLPGEYSLHINSANNPNAPPYWNQDGDPKNTCTW